MYKFDQEILDKAMTFDDFQQYTLDIIDKKNIVAPYDNPDYLSFTVANHRRIDKILKDIQLSKKLYNELNDDVKKWTWIVFDEPWCSDASFSVPVLYAMSLASGGEIDFKIYLRDTHPEIMEHYLTDNGKAIPKLVCLDENMNELGTWGPRPAELQKLAIELKQRNADLTEKIKTSFGWYRKDKGESLQAEFIDLIKKWKNV
ncbi:MAG: thioredoxin family protein [Chitinophagales bacterium]